MIIALRYYSFFTVCQNLYHAIVSPGTYTMLSVFLFVCLFVFHWAYLCSTGNWFEGARGGWGQGCLFQISSMVNSEALALPNRFAQKR